MSGVRTCAGVDTQVYSFGAGDEPALMLHCTMGHSMAFMPLATGLNDLLSMTAFDLPGHGGSADWDGVTPIQRQTVDMALDLLTEPTHLIGHSFGGASALRLACERPELVKSLTLIEPVFFAAAYADHPGLKDSHMAEMAALGTAIDAGEPEKAARLFYTDWGGGRSWDALPEQMRRRAEKQIYLVVAANDEVGEDVGGLLAAGALENLAVPTLLLEGGRSPHYVAKVNAALAARIKGAERAVVENAGHMLPISHPKEVLSVIRPFMERVATAKGQAA